MLTIRRSDERGGAYHGWLDTKHTFSFAGYRDPEHMGFRSLRVLNEDRVAAGAGFPTHGHRDMEILSWVLEGALEHEDSMGNGSVVAPGELQRMTAGTGVRHSEYNASAVDPLRFLQIWVLPTRRGLEPSYEQQGFDDASLRNQWCLIASPDGAEGSVTIHQDLRLYATRLDAGAALSYTRAADRHVWLHVARGAVVVNGEAMAAGDAASTSELAELILSASEDAEILLFDLA